MFPKFIVTFFLVQLRGISIVFLNHTTPSKSFIPLFYSNAEKYGWEVSGDYNTNYKHTCWLEAAWMNQYKGKLSLIHISPVSFALRNDAEDKERILRALKQANGNRKVAAELLGIGRTTPVSYTHLDVYKRQPRRSVSC